MEDSRVSIVPNSLVRNLIMGCYKNRQNRNSSDDEQKPHLGLCVIQAFMNLGIQV